LRLGGKKKSVWVGRGRINREDAKSANKRYEAVCSGQGQPFARPVNNPSGAGIIVEGVLFAWQRD
jgi:hypothetical protein